MHSTTLVAIALAAAAVPALAAPVATSHIAARAAPVRGQDLDVHSDTVIDRINWFREHFPAHKRQDVANFDGSEALTLPSSETLHNIFDLGTKGVNLFSGVADLAGKIKDMITGKREELLARGIDVDDAALNLALVHILSNQGNKRQDAADFDGSEALTLPSAETLHNIFDLGTKGVNLFSGVADLAGKIKDMITGKREELLARGHDVDEATIRAALLQTLIKQSGKRQDVADLTGSEAITSETLHNIFDLGTKGVGLFNGVADLAGKIKDMITGKREELLARGIDVDAATLGQAYAHLLGQQIKTRQDSYVDGSEALTLPSAETLHNIFDLGTKGVGLFNGVADLAGKIKDMITGKREELLARGMDLDGAALGQALAESLSKMTKQQRREPFVIPNGSGLVPPIYRQGPFRNALGEKNFHAFTRGLNELD